MKGYCKIHAIAHCQECDWTEEHYEKAQSAGKYHNKKTGHKVCVEVGYFIMYNSKLKDKTLCKKQE